MVHRFVAAQALRERKNTKRAKRKKRKRAGKTRPKSPLASRGTGGYCQARARLELAAVEKVHGLTAEHLQASLPAQPLWCGRRVKVVDGSSVSMPDTPKNQKHYPQPGTQKPGCGFPVMRLVVVFCLASGLALEVAKSALKVSERALFHTLFAFFEAGDVLLADRGFCSYADFWRLRQQGVDCVMRNHQRRTTGVLQVKRLAHNDRLVDWIKMKPCPAGLTQQEWSAVPATMTVREVTVTVDIPGFRPRTIVLVTTLLDPKQFPAAALAQLYRQRWRAELFLRDIKTTMGMDVLRCKSPDMVEKELYMHLIAYNLVRALMAKAAHKRPAASPHNLSFTGALDTVRAFAPRMAAAELSPRQHQRLIQALLECLANDTLPQRPNRVEPRAKKRRPKNYPLLNKPRELFTEIPHRNRYKKNLN